MNLHDRLIQLGPDVSSIDILGKDGERWEVLGSIPLPSLPEREKGEEEDAHAARVAAVWESAVPELVREAEDTGRAAGVGQLRVRLVGEGKRVLSTIAITVLGAGPPPDVLPKEWPSDPHAQMAYVLTVATRASLGALGITQAGLEQLWRRHDALMGRYESLVEAIIPLHEDRAVTEALSEVEDGADWAAVAHTGLELFRDIRADAKSKAAGPIRAAEVPVMLLRLAKKIPPDQRGEALKQIQAILPQLQLELTATNNEKK